MDEKVFPELLLESVFSASRAKLNTAVYTVRLTWVLASFQARGVNVFPQLVGRK